MKTIVCSSPWCKATINVPDEYQSTQCPKCYSFDNELSGGVTWTEKKYEGPRMDGMPHPIDIKINKAGEKKKLW